MKKDHTEFANKQNSKRNLKNKKENNSPKKLNRSLAFPSLKIVWTRPPPPGRHRGLVSALRAERAAALGWSSPSPQAHTHP